MDRRCGSCGGLFGRCRAGRRRSLSSETGNAGTGPGDQARYRSDGQLELLGRLDEQFKLRGFRIEPGEVERAICAAGAVRECVVRPVMAPAGDERLVAWYVPGGAVDVAALRATLCERLPDYMRPALYVELAALPLTPNGKVNRRALPAPDWDAQAAVVTAARTPLESALAGLFAEVLGVATVDVHANFFDLGGHSLLATQLVSRIRDVLEVELPLKDLFEAPDVARLAERVEPARLRSMHGFAARVAAVLAKRRAAESRVRSPAVVHATAAVVHLGPVYEPGSVGVSTSHWCRMALQGEVDLPALQSALDAVVARHASLRTTFAVHDGEPVQVIDPDAARGHRGTRGRGRCRCPAGGAGGAAVRSRAGPAAAGAAGQARATFVGVADRAASHRHGRLVDGGAVPRMVAGVRGGRAGRGTGLVAVAAGICGLRGLAARLVDRRGARSAAGLLDDPACRCAAGHRAAARPAAAARAAQQSRRTGCTAANCRCRVCCR